MKTLIITEDTEISSSLSKIVHNFGYDTIIYKWFLKALDNIEEIQPDVIILNSCEYPRLWKTLVQFVKSGIGGENVKIYLYEPSPLSAEDQEKYAELGIAGCFKNINEEELSFLSDSGKNPPLANGAILISNPLTGQFLTGSFKSYEENILFCTMDFDFSNDFTQSTVIPFVTLAVNDKIEDYDGAYIRKINKDKKQMILEVQ